MGTSEFWTTLIGSVITKVTNDDNYRLTFRVANGDEYIFHHEQDCCESVSIDDIEGDWDDLIGSPLIIAEETTDRETDGEGRESWTWTFYRFATEKGYVTVKWLGESNGYYSESVDYYKSPQS